MEESQQIKTYSGETPPEIGRIHSELGESLNSGMRKLRAQIFCYIEMLGLEHQQTESFKQTVKSATTDFWSNYEALIAKKLCELSESPYGHKGKEKD